MDKPEDRDLKALMENIDKEMFEEHG